MDPTGGFQGGALRVQTGGQNFFANFFSPESSGGWSREFTLEVELLRDDFETRSGQAGGTSGHGSSSLDAPLPMLLGSLTSVTPDSYQPQRRRLKPAPLIETVMSSLL